jgi:tetratricopeptide (TPR) repeat protein
MAARASWLASLAACALGLLGCGATQTTQRVFHGNVVVGPYIEPEAYAAFAEGAYLEQRGDWDGAAAAYRRARARDPDSPGIAARLGAIACRTSLEAALDEFQTSGIARDYAPAWAERARCLLAHRDSARALEAARRAVMLDKNNADANLSIAQIHREQGQPERARTWLLAWALGDPGASAYRDSIAEQARLLGDNALALWIASLGRDASDDSSGAEPDTPRSPRRLAQRAIAAGQLPAAAEHAAMALDADPADPNALVIALLAASLAPDEARFAELLARARASASPPEADVAAWMAELIRVRVGDERWLAAHRRVSAPRP